MDVLTVAATVAALVGGVVAAIQAAAVFRSGRAQSMTQAAIEEESLEDRVRVLIRLLGQSSDLLSQVSAEIDARAATATRRMQEAAQAQELADLRKEEREAVAQLVRAEVGAAARRSSRRALLANVLFFIAGGLVSLAITLWVHPL